MTISRASGAVRHRCALTPPPPSPPTPSPTPTPTPRADADTIGRGTIAPSMPIDSPGSTIISTAGGQHHGHRESERQRRCDLCQVDQLDRHVGNCRGPAPGGKCRRWWGERITYGPTTRRGTRDGGRTMISALIIALFSPHYGVYRSFADKQHYGPDWRKHAMGISRGSCKPVSCKPVSCKPVSCKPVNSKPATVCEPLNGNGPVRPIAAEEEFDLRNLPITQTEHVLLSLAKVVEQRDQHTAGHSERLAVTSVALGLAMKLDRPSLLALYLGGFLHDVGKVGIPDSILFKPGKLSEEEWEIMRGHSARGEEICRPLVSLRSVLPSSGIIMNAGTDGLPGSAERQWDPAAGAGAGGGYLRCVDQSTSVQAGVHHDELEVLGQEAARGWRDPESLGFCSITQRMLSKIAGYQPAAELDWYRAGIGRICRNIWRISAELTADELNKTDKAMRATEFLVLGVFFAGLDAHGQFVFGRRQGRWRRKEGARRVVSLVESSSIAVPWALLNRKSGPRRGFPCRRSDRGRCRTALWHPGFRGRDAGGTLAKKLEGP